MGGGEGDNRGWDGWMASPTRWTWVWAGSGSWWRTGKPGVLQSTGSQELDVTERLSRTELKLTSTAGGKLSSQTLWGCPLLWGSSLSPTSWLSMRWPGPGAARQAVNVAPLAPWMAQLLLSVSLVDRQWNWQGTPPLITLYVRPQIVLLVSIKPHRLHSISTLVSEHLLISADYSYFCFLKFSKFYRLFLWEAVF